MGEGTAPWVSEVKRAAYDIYLAGCNGLLALPGHRLRLAVLRRLARASVGADTSVGRRLRIEGKGGITIGPGCNINARTHLDGRSGLWIGAGVNISPEAILLSAEHDLRSPHFDGRSRRTIVGDRAWIASRAMILPGADIGEGAVVGAGAVVKGRVDPWTIVAGNPARVVGERPRDAQQVLHPYRRWPG
jgi:putative colanic acid biosynthesis acetyltransferase WcaF